MAVAQGARDAFCRGALRIPAQRRDPHSVVPAGLHGKAIPGRPRGPPARTAGAPRATARRKSRLNRAMATKFCEKSGLSARNTDPDAQPAGKEIRKANDYGFV